MEEPIKERIISTMFERWCSQIDHDLEQREAMDRAIKEPDEDTIFHLAAVTEARAYKAGFRDCLDMIKELFNK